MSLINILKVRPKNVQFYYMKFLKFYGSKLIMFDSLQVGKLAGKETKEASWVMKVLLSLIGVVGYMVDRVIKIH